MDEIDNYVRKTTNYSKFKILKGNREIDHHERIKKSMEEKALFTAIYVNENLEILEGQNRFFALKELGLPIRYIIIEGYGIEEARRYNMDAKNWTKLDYVKSFADEGHPEYTKIIEFKKEFPDFEMPCIEYLLRLSMNNDYNSKNINSFNSIKKGQFIIKDYERSRKVANMIMAYKPFCQGMAKPYYKRKEFVSAIIKLNRLSEFDNDVIIQKLTEYPTMLKPCLNNKEYIEQLEYIFNFRRRGGKVRFVID